MMLIQLQMTVFYILLFDLHLMRKLNLKMLLQVYFPNYLLQLYFAIDMLLMHQLHLQQLINLLVGLQHIKLRYHLYCSPKPVIGAVTKISTTFESAVHSLGLVN